MTLKREPSSKCSQACREEASICCGLHGSLEGSWHGLLLDAFRENQQPWDKTQHHCIDNLKDRKQSRTKGLVPATDRAPWCLGITLSQEILVFQTGQDCVTSDCSEHDNCVQIVPAKACKIKNFAEPK